MRPELLIVGAGGHGREAFAVASAINAVDRRWSLIRFVDDGTVVPELMTRLGAQLPRKVATVARDHCDHVIAIGDPTIRRSVANGIGIEPRPVKLVDPGARIGPDVVLGDGTMVFPGSIITTNVRIGTHSHVNSRAVVSHDCTIGDFVSLSPGVMLNGAVVIEDDVFLGTGAIVLPGRRIGQGAVVGAGAVVCDDVEPFAMVVGTPARPLNRATSMTAAI